MSAPNLIAIIYACLNCIVSYQRHEIQCQVDPLSQAVFTINPTAFLRDKKP